MHDTMVFLRFSGSLCNFFSIKKTRQNDWTRINIRHWANALCEIYFFLASFKGMWKLTVNEQDTILITASIFSIWFKIPFSVENKISKPEVTYFWYDVTSGKKNQYIRSLIRLIPGISPLLIKSQNFQTGSDIFLVCHHFRPKLEFFETKNYQRRSTVKTHCWSDDITNFGTITITDCFVPTAGIGRSDA